MFVYLVYFTLAPNVSKARKTLFHWNEPITELIFLLILLNELIENVIVERDVQDFCSVRRAAYSQQLVILELRELRPQSEVRIDKHPIAALIVQFVEGES